MTTLPKHVVRLPDLSNRKTTDIALALTDPERRAIAADLGLNDLRKLTFNVKLTPSSRKDWDLEATLGATVVQDCVVTLTPIATRIDEKIRRRYMADLPKVEATEIEMPEDDTIEPLPVTLDLVEVMIEALSLALPPYPRADGAEIGEFVVTEPGAVPLTQSEMKPFSGLAALRDKLEQGGDGDS